MIGAGDYDYEDSHYLPAGCQYNNVSDLELQTLVRQKLRRTEIAQAPSIASAYGSGDVGAPAPARSSAMPAAMAPAQAPAPGAYTGRRAILSTNPTYLAPAPAPEHSSRGSQRAPAMQNASLSSNGDRPGLVSLVCKPIAAKTDSLSDTSSDNTLLIVLVTVIPGIALIGIFVGLFYFLHKSKLR